MSPRPHSESPAANSGLCVQTFLRFLFPLALWGCASDVDNLAFYVLDPDKAVGAEGVYTYDVFEGTSRLLVAGKASHLMVSPDGQRLAVMHQKPANPFNFTSRVVSVADGHALTSTQDWFPLIWIGNSHLLERKLAGMSYSFVQRNLDGSESRMLFRSETPRTARHLSVSQDGRTLIWLESVAEHGADTLRSLDLNSGALSQTLPMGEAAHVLGSAPIFLPDGNIGWTNVDSTAFFVSDRAFMQIKRRVVAREADIIWGPPSLQAYVNDQLLISRASKIQFHVLAPGAGLMQSLTALNDLAATLSGFPLVEVSRARTFAYVSDSKTRLFTRPDGSGPRAAPRGITSFYVN